MGMNVAAQLGELGVIVKALEKWHVNPIENLLPRLYPNPTPVYVAALPARRGPRSDGVLQTTVRSRNDNKTEKNIFNVRQPIDGAMAPVCFI
jgi:hypothetical protein